MGTAVMPTSARQGQMPPPSSVLDPPPVEAASGPASEQGLTSAGAMTLAPTRWRGAMAASGILHATVAASVLFGLVRLTPPSKVADAAMTVELAPSPSAPPVPPRQTPPAPEQVRAVAKPVPRDQPKIPPPPESPASKPEVAMQATPQRQPDRPVQKVAAEQTTAPSAVAAPSKPQSAAPVLGSSAVASNAPQTWENLLLAKLQRHKRYPDAAQSRGMEDVVYVRMAIDRQGRLLNANIVRSRGFAPLDSEVIALTRRASPFPAPPPNEEGDPVVVVVPVEFFVTHRRGY